MLVRNQNCSHCSWNMADGLWLTISRTTAQLIKINQQASCKSEITKLGTKWLTYLCKRRRAKTEAAIPDCSSHNKLSGFATTAITTRIYQTAPTVGTPYSGNDSTTSQVGTNVSTAKSIAISKISAKTGKHKIVYID